MVTPSPTPPSSKKVHPADEVRFSLLPCKVRENKFVPSGDEPQDFSWRTLCARFAPARTREAVLPLRQLQMGGFVGLVRGPRGISNFVLVNADRSGRFDQGLIKDKEFAHRVVEVFRVERADWGVRTIEPV